ncbi:succinate dehydrogenase, cytochrome b556 subunit [Rhizomicrobium electricum]|jgi:succinate dehydrogenase / fumarate reductase cytochrome b subunit|uniref:Succinate dehydrogenase cytochrome b556 subunit n=1 Tax=Rhizomicrobium electricum TaxID=480070 RepID=A0ABP3P419_9PROT|nr:succinate dehydrogenase, cytochrome b556 subunit [Rhizomicrobium electricum]NIJ47263.1 succinate dehydrogenase / fumarate reductase cytochrome b subunit [Rhizomicrobium electricum]
MAEHLKPRPLSPFLTIFRWPVTMATSIVHRVTGVGLAGGLVVLVWWLIAASSGPEAYNFFIDLAETTIGQICLFGFTWALAYHAVNGIRHLAWDLGYGYQVRTADISGIAVIVLSVLIAIGVFAIAYAGYGGYYQ